MGQKGGAGRRGDRLLDGVLYQVREEGLSSEESKNDESNNTVFLDLKTVERALVLPLSKFFIADADDLLYEAVSAVKALPNKYKTTWNAPRDSFSTLVQIDMNIYAQEPNQSDSDEEDELLLDGAEEL